MHSTLHYRLALAIADERRKGVRRTRLPVAELSHGRTVRRWIGRQLVRAGTRLAGEPNLRPARAR